MAITATQRTDIIRLVVGMFGAAPGATVLSDLAASVEAGRTMSQLAGDLANTNEFKGIYPSFFTNTEFATKLVDNLVGSELSAANRTWAIDQVTAMLNAGQSRAAVVKAVIDGVNAVAVTDTNFGAASQALKNKVEVAEYYSVTKLQSGSSLAQLQAVVSSVTSSAATVTSSKASIDTSSSVGGTFTLTTSSDSLTGTANNDTFNAGLVSGTMTFDAGDNLNGGAGTDTLNLTINAASTYQAASITNIEKVNVVFSTTANGTLSLAGVAGITDLTAQGASVNGNFTNIASTSTNLKATNTGSDISWGFAAAAVAGTADAVTLELSGVTGGTQTINSVETLNLVSSSSANTVTLTAGAATKIVATGDQNLTLNTLPATVATLDSSGLTAGRLSATLGAVAAATVTGGVGNDLLTVSAVTGNVNVNGGAGNDTITAAANLANTDTIDGGDGTDTLSTTSALAVGYTKPTTYRISNIETLSLSDALATTDLTVANLATGITRLNLTAGTTDARTVTMEAGSMTVSLGAILGDNLTVVDTGTATTDSLTILNSGSAINAANGKNLTITGYETATYSGSGTGTATAQTIATLNHTADTGGTATFNVTGSNSVTITDITATGKLDASGLTGTTAALTMTNAPTAITSIVGGPNSDTLKGDASSNIDGGAGNDNITGGTGNDTLLGGAGNDTITTNTGSDSVDGGDGNDTLVFAGNLATGDVVDGGAGDDTLSITNATLTTLAGYSISTVVALNDKISNVERVLVSDALDQTSFDMARLDSLNYIVLGGGWAGAETIQGLGAGSTIILNDGETSNTVANALTLTYTSSSGTADAITIGLVNDASTNFEAVTLSGIENVTVTTAEVTSTTTAEVHTLKLNLTGATTLTLSGTESLDITGAAVGATTIDATGIAHSTATTAPYVKVTGTSANQTITGSAGADTIDAGGGADTVDGGAGADSLTGGAGADSITGGTGSDTINGGSGNDTIVLTESTAAVDHVELTYSEAGTSIDNVIGFTTTSSGDKIKLSLGGLEAVGTSGIHSAATNFQQLDADTAAAAGAAAVQVLTGAATAGANNVFVLSGTTFASLSDVEDAIETGGTYALTVSATDAHIDVADAFIVVWTDGSNAHVSAVRVVTDPGTNGVFAAGATKAVDLVTLAGVSSIGSTTFASANFDWIA